MIQATRYTTILGSLALIILGIAWEIHLAPVRPGAWSLALKVLPLALSMPGLIRGHRRTYQWWSMGMLAYLGEGLVRATSDTGPSVPLAWIEVVLATIVWCAILLFARAGRAAK